MLSLLETHVPEYSADNQQGGARLLRVDPVKLQVVAKPVGLITVVEGVLPSKHTHVGIADVPAALRGRYLPCTHLPGWNHFPTALLRSR